MSFRSKLLSLTVLLAIPCAASAQEWRFCIGADQVGENMRAPLMFTHVFRSDLVSGYEQQIAAHVERKLTISGEVTVNCTDPYPTEDGATDKMIEWLDMMTNGDVRMEVISARWEPEQQTGPQPAQQSSTAAHGGGDELERTGQASASGSTGYRKPMWCYATDYDVERGPRAIVTPVFEGEHSEERDYESSLWGWADDNYDLRHNITVNCYSEDSHNDARAHLESSIRSWQQHDHRVVNVHWTP